MHDENCRNIPHLLQSSGLAGALVVVGAASDVRLAVAASVLHQHQSNIFQACPSETAASIVCAHSGAGLCLARLVLHIAHQDVVSTHKFKKFKKFV